MRRISPILAVVASLPCIVSGTWAQEPGRHLDDAISAYESATHRIFAGAPEDWSTHHIVFSNPKAGSEAEYQVQKDPRFWLQQIRHEAMENGESFARRLPKQRRKSLRGDWAESVGAGGSVFAGQYPAKFSFSTGSTVTSANCTTDYVIYNTGLNGSTTQASIIAFNNLYPGICTTGTVPNVLWAYNTSGTTPAGPIETSVTLSSDGKQAAFVISGTTATLVLLKMPTANATGRTITPVTTSNGSTTVTAASGSFSQTDVGARVTGGSGNIPAGDTIASFVSSSQITLATAATGTNTSLTIAAETLAAPGVAPTVTNANYATCTGACLTTLTLTQADTVSAPVYDYSGSDNLWVGAGTGILHKFHPVFSGTPAEVTTGGFPATVSGNGQALTSPVFDSTHNLVLVGDAHASGAANDGELHSVSSTGTVTSSSQICHGAGYVDAPLVDPTANRVYIACGNDQAAGACTSGSTCVRQFTANAISGAGTGAQIGASTADVAVYSGAFDNTYFTSASGSSPSGNMYICGNAGGAPTLFRVPIAANVMGAVVTVNTLSAGTSTTAATCGPVSEFFNSSTSTDWLFIGETMTGNKTGCTNAGCVYSFNSTSVLAAGTNATAGFAANGGSSGIIVDNIGTNNTTNKPANVYFSALTNSTAGNLCNGTSGVGCAYQARQDTLN